MSQKNSDPNGIYVDEAEVSSFGRSFHRSAYSCSVVHLYAVHSPFVLARSVRATLLANLYIHSVRVRKNSTYLDLAPHACLIPVKTLSCRFPFAGIDSCSAADIQPDLVNLFDFENLVVGFEQHLQRTLVDLHL